MMLLHMLDEIRSFIVLAESGSLRRASERLFLTPSALTRQIQRLEQALGTTLLDRRVKPARITLAGRAVLDRLRAVDDVAYLRFASVYKGFAEAGDFEREVGLLTKSTQPKRH